ncbi:MAG: hypothetical protein GY867_04690, partial [bacterium]|nr:hypothetical protein [bacterium]
VSKLAGKRGFYAGLSLAGAGLLGRGLIVLARRRSNTQSAKGLVDEGQRDATIRRTSTKTSQDASSPQKSGSPQAVKPIKMRRIPHLPARMKIKPTGRSLSTSDKCAGCQASADSKPGPWYHINGRLYCQDCSPNAAREAEVDLVGDTPKSEQASKSEQVDNYGLKNAKPRLEVGWPFKRLSTKLSRSRVRAYVGQDAGRPLYWVVKNGYGVLKTSRPSRKVLREAMNVPGLDPTQHHTGLVIIPALKLNSTKTNIVEDTRRWSIIHLSSGKPLLPGATEDYSTREQAHQVADALAKVDWNRPAEELAEVEIKQAVATIKQYNQALAAQPAIVAGGRSRNGSQVGRIMADDYGGIVRVIEDKGDTLVLLNSLGKRYETSRSRLRLPNSSDFEGSGVAQSFDPASRPEKRCGRCRGSSRRLGGKWYMMKWQPFCQGCAKETARKKDYILEDQVGDE